MDGSNIVNEELYEQKTDMKDSTFVVFVIFEAENRTYNRNCIYLTDKINTHKNIKKNDEKLLKLDHFLLNFTVVIVDCDFRILNILIFVLNLFSVFLKVLLL